MLKVLSLLLLAIAVCTDAQRQMAGTSPYGNGSRQAAGTSPYGNSGVKRTQSNSPYGGGHHGGGGHQSNSPYGGGHHGGGGHQSNSPYGGGHHGGGGHHVAPAFSPYGAGRPTGGSNGGGEHDGKTDRERGIESANNRLRGHGPRLFAPAASLDNVHSWALIGTPPAACIALKGKSASNPPTCPELKACDAELGPFCATLPAGQAQAACAQGEKQLQGAMKAMSCAAAAPAVVSAFTWPLSCKSVATTPVSCAALHACKKTFSECDTAPFPARSLCSAERDTVVNQLELLQCPKPGCMCNPNTIIATPSTGNVDCSQCAASCQAVGLTFKSCVESFDSDAVITPFVDALIGTPRVPAACIALHGKSASNPPTCPELKACDAELGPFCATLPAGQAQAACAQGEKQLQGAMKQMSC